MTELVAQQLAALALCRRVPDGCPSSCFDLTCARADDGARFSGAG